MRHGDIVIIKKPDSAFHNQFGTYLFQWYADGAKLETMVSIHTPVHRHLALQEYNIQPVTDTKREKSDG